MQMNKLTWSNYKIVEEKIRKKFKLSIKPCISYLIWTYYGTKIYWVEESDDIYFIGENNYSQERIDEMTSRESRITKEDYIESKYIILIPQYIISEKEYIEKAVDIIKNNSNQKIIFINGVKNKSLFDEEPLYSWNTNYIYNSTDFVGFQGKKFQKKRNHLNFFINNFSEDTTTKKYSPENKKEVFDFLVKEIESSETSSKEEIDVYNDILDNFDSQKMSGLIVYYKDKIVGFTLGYLYDEYYEIPIERCSKDYRGLYQYIITQNVRENVDINVVKYIDRQDDMGEENLMKSKLSYNPINVITSNVYKIEIKNIH